LGRRREEKGRREEGHGFVLWGVVVRVAAFVVQTRKIGRITSANQRARFSKAVISADRIDRFAREGEGLGPLPE
jgi:hypothetical protein